MVEVNSEAEQQLITGMYGSENYHWIGLNQDQPGISTISLVRFDRLEWRVDMEGTNNSRTHVSHNLHSLVIKNVTENNETFWTIQGLRIVLK